MQEQEKRLAEALSEKNQADEKTRLGEEKFRKAQTDNEQIENYRKALEQSLALKGEEETMRGFDASLRASRKSEAVFFARREEERCERQLALAIRESAEADRRFATAKEAMEQARARDEKAQATKPDAERKKKERLETRTALELFSACRENAKRRQAIEGERKKAKGRASRSPRKGLRCLRHASSSTSVTPLTKERPSSLVWKAN